MIKGKYTIKGGGRDVINTKVCRVYSKRYRVVAMQKIWGVQRFCRRPTQCYHGFRSGNEACFHAGGRRKLNERIKYRGGEKKAMNRTESIYEEQGRNNRWPKLSPGFSFTPTPEGKPVIVRRREEMQKATERLRRKLEE